MKLQLGVKVDHATETVDAEWYKNGEKVADVRWAAKMYQDYWKELFPNR